MPVANTRAYPSAMTAGMQHIEVLFAQESGTLEIDLEDDNDADEIADALVAALESDDPEDAERRLAGAMPLGVRVRRQG